jgi:RecA/RadA recombinase
MTSEVSAGVAPQGALASMSALSPTETFTRVTDKSYAEKMREINALRQKNPETFVSAEDLESPYLLRRPTGIIELDIALGGGFPAGGGAMLSGPYGSGKSWLLWRMFAMQQRIYGDDFIGAIAHTEGAMDFEWIRKVGCYIAVPDNVLNNWNEIRHQRGYPQLSSTEIDFWKRQVGHIETIQGDTGEKILEGVLGLTSRSVCNIVAIDSISSLQPQADAEKDLDEFAKRGAHAFLMKQFWLNYVPTTRRGTNNTTLMMVQQVVANQSKGSAPSPMQKYIQDWEVKGGEASKHFKLIDVVLWSGAKINDNNKVAIGKEVHYKTLKGKAGTHENITGEFRYYYDLFGTDMYGDLIRSAAHRGVITNFGGYFMVTNWQTRQPLEGTKYPTENDLRMHLMGNVNFEFFVRREVFASAGVQCLYR